MDRTKFGSAIEDCGDYSLHYFENTLNSMGIQGIKRKYWLKIYHKDPKKAGRMFFEKLDREFENERSWAVAKHLLLKKYPHWGPTPLEERAPVIADYGPEPEPRPIFDGRRSCEATPITYNLEYFLQINGGRWGDCMADIDEYERVNGVII